MESQEREPTPWLARARSSQPVDIKHEPASEQLVAIVALLDQVRGVDPPPRCPMTSIAPVPHGLLRTTETDVLRNAGDDMARAENGRLDAPLLS